MLITRRESNSRAGALRWFQYSLRTLLIFTTLVALGFGYVGYKLQRAERREEAVRAFDKVGAILCVQEFPDGRDRLMLALRDEPKYVTFLLHKDNKVRDDDLRWLADLPDIWRVSLSNSRITDSGLKHLAGCPFFESSGLIIAGSRMPALPI